MAVAAWLVWRNHGIRGATVALAIFVVQLALYSGWSWLFFGLHLAGVAFDDLRLKPQVKSASLHQQAL